MIVTLCSGSAFGSSAATTAWPDSWYAQVIALVLGHRQRTPLHAHQHLVARLVEIGVGDGRPAALDREERGLVHQIRQVGARKARRAARDLPQVDVRIERHLPAVDAENLLAALHVRRADGHLPIEAPGTEQRRIENVRPVRRRDDDDALIGREAVHLHQKLIQRLLALLVAERVAAAAPSDGVELVDEDDARVVAPRILEELADPRRADARVHLDEIRAAREQKRDLRFAGHRARQQRLAGSRRPDEQNAFRNASADRRKARRLAQKIDNLLHFLFRFVNARDVGERHRRLFGIRRACLAFERRDASRRDAIQGDAEQPEEAEAQDERAVAVRVLFRRRANVDADVLLRQIGMKAGFAVT